MSSLIRVNLVNAVMVVNARRTEEEYITIMNIKIWIYAIKLV